MSFDAIRWAIEQDEGLSPTAKHVLVMLADFQNKDEDVCYPKITQIAAKALMSESGVRKCIVELEEVGLLKVTPRNRGSRSKSNLYELLTKPTSPDGGSKCHEVADGDDTAGLSIEPVIQPVKEPVNIAAEPQEDDEMKLSEIITGEVFCKKEKAEIFEKAKRKDGKLTPAGCFYLWKHCRASADDDNGVQVEPTSKDQSQLAGAYKRVGEVFPEVVWRCMSNWIGFMKHAQSTAGAFPPATHPSIWFFVKYIEAAADFTPAAKAKAAPVKSIAIEQPLTKATNESKHTYSQPATAEEIKAIGEQFGL